MPGPGCRLGNDNDVLDNLDEVVELLFVVQLCLVVVLVPGPPRTTCSAWDANPEKT